MKLTETFGNKHLAAPLALMFFSYPAFCDDKPKPPAKPAAPSKAAPAKPASGGAATAKTSGPTTAPHGPTTTSHGPTTTSPKGPTTTTSRTTTTAGTKTTAPGGGAKTPNSIGAKTPLAVGHTTVSTKTGGTVEKRADGKVATLHDPKRGMDVHHGLDGNRRVVVERGDHSRIVAERGGRGYVQRPYMYHGHEYASRSYYYNGRYYNNYYGRYYYRGVYVNPYYPSYYYGPAYYGWAYNPWVAPVSYGWGWGGNPWYGYYGGYFTPYQVYPSAAFWLTDYMIANSLQAAYQAQAAQSAALSNPVPLTEATKQLISDEVRQQIALENTESKTAGQNAEPDPASSSIQRALTDGKQHVFVAGQSLDVVDASGVECALSEGDAIQLAGPTAPDAQSASLSVLASKGGKECARGDSVSVSITDLQDMQNHMRETIDQGMKELQAKQGQGGLPAAPSAARVAPVESQMASSAPPPPPEKEVAAQIAEQSQQADKAEAEALGGAPSGPGPNASAPATEQTNIQVGSTVAQLDAAMGQPLRVVKMGTKEVRTYTGDTKITVKDGKVTAVD